MKNRIFNEDEVLSEAFRKRVIKEILGSENQARRAASARRFELYRDKISKWVIMRLSKEFSAETVKVMSNRATNVNVLKKIVNKRAKSYSNGVSRDFVPEKKEGGLIRRFLGIFGKRDQDEAGTVKFNEQMHAVARMLGIDAVMKKTDRYSELDRICTVLLAPCDMKDEAGKPVKVPTLRVIPASGYDVIEDGKNPELARAYILSDFDPAGAPSATGGMDASPGGYAGIRGGEQTHVLVASAGDGRDQLIADQNRDDAERVFIWWTEKYHFSTNIKGTIIARLSPTDNLNPIGELPFIDIHQDRDDAYWPEGGDDAVEGTVLINVTLTDMFAILNYQGWGQLVVAGKGLRDNVETGPNKAITFDVKEGDPTPIVEYKSASPPIEFWLRAIEQQVALVLSTNDLSTRHVQGSLAADNVTSGIGKIVDDAELTMTVTDKQASFSGWERRLWKIYRLWHNGLYDRLLLPADLHELGKLPDFDVIVRFSETKPILTETEKCDILEKRKKLGTWTLEDIVRFDNPDMGPDDVIKKIEKIRQDAIDNAWFWKTASAPKEIGNDEGAEEEDPAQGAAGEGEGEEDGEGASKAPFPPKK